MTKKAKYLFLIMAILFLDGCGNGSSTLTSQSNSETMVEAVACAFSIPINSDVTFPGPGDMVYLIPAVDENTFGWTFRWQSDPDILLDDDMISASLIVPNDTPEIEVDLEASTAEGCVGTGSLLIPVDLPIVEATEESTESTASPAATEAVTVVPTAVPTDDPTPTPEPTEAPTATATDEPTPTDLPVPTATPTPISAPIITQLQFLPGGAVYVAWTWDGELSPTQNFAVRFWSESDPRPEARFSITWTKEMAYQFGVNNIDYPVGTYLINVAVMEGSSEGTHYAVAESTNEPLFVADIPPTEVPVIP